MKAIALHPHVAGSMHMRDMPDPPMQAGEASLDSARRITREEAIKLVKAKKAVYVDVRPREQYDQGHIKGAISIPESEIVTGIRKIAPGKMIITYCA